MGMEVQFMSKEDLVKIIESTKKFGLKDFCVNEEIYWAGYIEGEESFVVDTIIDSPKYFDTSFEAANYLYDILYCSKALL